MSKFSRLCLSAGALLAFAVSAQAAPTKPEPTKAASAKAAKRKPASDGHRPAMTSIDEVRTAIRGRWTTKCLPMPNKPKGSYTSEYTFNENGSSDYTARIFESDSQCTGTAAKVEKHKALNFEVELCKQVTPTQGELVVVKLQRPERVLPTVVIFGFDPADAKTLTRFYPLSKDKKLPAVDRLCESVDFARHSAYLRQE